MPPKRAPASDVATSTVFKKQKLDAARRIHVEPPSRLPPDSMEGLPATIDIERFAQARHFEIGAMQSAMKNATATASHRVWQTLPRHLRRRAASHDVRRVPFRLREKAKLEIDPTKRKTFLKLLKRKKRVARESRRAERFSSRQKDKTWLETHLWHAKRMHMQNIWGHRLAIRPTEKSYRPSHRAAVHGSTLHDVSYISTIELTGQMQTLVSVLKQCCNPCGTGPWATRYTSGARTCRTHLHTANSWPKGLIAPATILWRPGEDTSDPSTSTHNTPPQEVSRGSESRTLWIRTHPTALIDVTRALKASHEHVSTTGQLDITDLSGDINAFELVGPRTSQVIHGAFQLANSGRDVGKFWKVLANARSPGNFSPGMAVGLTVHDPRLHYPPANTKLIDTTNSEDELVTPSSRLAQSRLWGQDTRDKLRTPAFKKAGLDHRRSKNLVPGTRLRPTKEDDQIPIILIQHTISASHAQSPKGHGAPQPMYGWTILLPPSWSMPFLNSLVYTGTRVVGLSARHHQKLEANYPHFPDDYVGAPAYVDSMTQRASAEQAKWERTPKGKRINYESIGTTHPWMSDWDSLAGGPAGAASEDLIPTDRPVHESLVKPPWLFLFPDAAQFVKDVAGDPNSTFLEAFGDWLNLRRSRRDMTPLNSDLIQTLFDSAIVHVRVDMLSRGNPKDRAVLYGFPTNEAASQWRAAFESQSDNDARSEMASTEGEQSCIIGHVTSGSFSLQVGRGHGIGAVSLKYMVEMARNRQAQLRAPIHNVPLIVSPSTKIPPTLSQLVRVRNPDGEIAQPAFVILI